MGRSTNAYLFYGFTFHDPEGVEMYIVPPWADKTDKDRVDNWWDWQEKLSKEVVEKLDCLEITIDYHCCVECPMYFITHKRTYVMAFRGYPAVVNSEFLTQDRLSTFDQNIKEACELLGIPWQQPKLCLVSYTD